MIEKTYNVGIYCRLSNDDERDGESVSIENQKLLLQSYVRQRGWNEIAVYCDDGYSGTNFDRPGVKRLIEDAKAKKINLILVKDLSRFGRNYIEFGQYTDYLFPSLGCRFIALNNGIDTESRNGSTDVMCFLNLFKNISHSGKVSNDFSLFRRFCCINRCFRCSCGKFSIVHGEQACVWARQAARTAENVVQQAAQAATQAIHTAAAGTQAAAQHTPETTRPASSKTASRVRKAPRPARRHLPRHSRLHPCLPLRCGRSAGRMSRFFWAA